MNRLHFGKWVHCPELFKTKVVASGDCLLWTGAKNNAGYGQLRWDGRTQYAHRVSYQLAKGPIPSGLTIDHLCRVRACINPGHLEAVSLKTNILRGTSPSAQQARQTHCIHGHELTDDNVYRRSNGARMCRTCQRTRDREAWRTGKKKNNRGYFAAGFN